MENRVSSHPSPSRCYILLSLCAWVILLMVKRIVEGSTQLLPLPYSIFWMATGVLFSLPIFITLTDTQVSLNAIIPSSIKGSVMALIATLFGISLCGLLFYLDFLQLNQKSPIYFAAAPFFAWVLTRVSSKESRSRLQLFSLLIISIGVGISVCSSDTLSLTYLSSLLLTLFLHFTLLTKKRGGSPQTILFFLSTLGVALSGIFLLVSSPVKSEITFASIYSCATGGLALGLSLLIFLEAFIRAGEKERVILIFPAVLISLSPMMRSIQGLAPFLIAAIILLPAFQLIKGLNQKTVSIPR